MTEEAWLACNDVYDLFEHIKTSASARKTRLLGCACVRWAWEWGLNEPLPEAVHVAEAFADVLATYADLRRVARDMGVLWREHDEPYRPYPRTCELTEALASPNNECAWLGEINSFAGDLCIADEPEWLRIVEFVHDIFGNPFRPALLDATRRTPDVVSLARAAYDERQLSSGELDVHRLAVLADALEEAGAPDELVAHLRSPGPHVRGCFAVDLCLGLH